MVFWPYYLVVVLLFAAGLSSAGLVVYSWQRRNAVWSTTYAVMMITLSWWSSTYALQILSPTLPQKIFWETMQLSLVNTIGISFFVFAMRYTGSGDKLTKPRLLLISAIPLFGIFSGWTDAWHHLYRAQTILEPTGPFLSLKIIFGPIFWFQLYYDYLLIVLAIVLLIRAFVRWSQPYKGQAGILIFSSIFPLLANVFTNFDIIPLPPFDFTPLAFNVTGFLMAWGLFRYRLFDVLPVARRMVLDNIDDAVLVLDKQNRLVDVNYAAQKMLGRPSSQLIGRLVGSFLPQSELLAQYRSVTEAHTEIIIDVEKPEPGMPPWQAFDLRISPLHDAHGELHGRIVMLRDITSWKRAENELKAQKMMLENLAEEYRQAKEAAEAANKAKSVFLANMSHELRTPLNAIIGYSEMLQEDAAAEGSDDLVPDLQRIEKSGQHLLALINNILDVSKIEAGKMDLYLEEFDVAHLINEVTGMIRPLIEKNHNSLIVDIADLGGMVADSVKVQQVLFNILSNAAKFTENGQITLHGQRKSITSQNNGHDTSEYICITISDTGIGMTEAQTVHLFQPFMQGDSSSTRKYGGSGLGLAISSSYCRMMGGHISVESEPGSGTTFTICLPTQVTMPQHEQLVSATW
ncbi:MAG: histidine kinase N-terminal 7TM domain-containing protein [Chloroflexota bacterium]|nr:PAS domain-containing protein [Ardenticatenaceae bacterium]